jgi:hypothetical protein
MRRVTGPGYSCVCRTEPDPCPPCPTTKARAELYHKYQIAGLPRPGVRYPTGSTR